MTRRDLASFGERSPSVAPQGACGSGARFVYRRKSFCIFDASHNRACLCARIRPSIGFATSLELGLGADSCDSFVFGARGYERKLILAELSRAPGSPNRRRLERKTRPEVSGGSLEGLAT